MTENLKDFLSNPENWKFFDEVDWLSAMSPENREKIENSEESEGVDK